MPKKAGMKAELLEHLRAIPRGRVTSPEALAEELGMPPPLVATVLAGLSEDERDLVPWHRVVAKGGAIGRGPHRDQQFARLVREGVMVSPAGIVQDLPRVMVFDFAEPVASERAKPEIAPPPAAGGRSRGMKSRP